MSLSNLRIEVACDYEGCENTIFLDYTLLAQAGWYFKPELEECGWRVDGDVTICPNHDEE